MEINLDHKNIKITFLLSLVLTITMPSLWPTARLMFFVPFLVICMYQKRLQTCLWYAFAGGLILDLLSSSPRLGMYAFAFCTASLVLYPQRRNFFADSLSTLPIMTFAFSSLSTLVLATLFYVIEMQNMFSGKWIFTDLIAMPVADGAYAFVVFVLPALLFGKRIRRGKEYFL